MNFPGKGERLVTVIVDGNNHNMIAPDGKRVIIQTKITDNIVTMDKCKEITANIQKLGHKPKKLEFVLDIYAELNTEHEYFTGIPYLLQKTVKYNVELNRLSVWQNGKLVYVNDNGVVCNDNVALADTYL